MAQSITNKIQPTQGLIKAPNTALPSVFSPMAGSTTQMFPQKTNMNLPKPTMVTNLNTKAQTKTTAAVPAKTTAKVPTQTQTLSTVNPNAAWQTGGIGLTPTPTPEQTPTNPSKGLFPTVVSSLAGMPAQYAELTKKATDIADSYGKEYASVGAQGARAKAGYLSTGTSPVAEGNAAIAAQTTAAQQSAIAAGQTAAMQGVTTGIQATQAGQSALGQAAQYSAPQVTSYGQTSFNPTTGTFDSGGSIPDDVMKQYAQFAVSGQYSSIPATITSNVVLNARLNEAAKALNPNYTPVGAQGASGVLAGIPSMMSANTAAEGIKNTINSYLQANPNLNPSDLAAGNLLQQWIQGKQLTDPKYQTLFNYLNEYTNTLAPILGVGGDPTNMKTQIAQGFINAAASGQSIAQVLDAMSKLATNKIQDLQSGAMGGSTSVPAAGGTGGFAEAW